MGAEWLGITPRIEDAGTNRIELGSGTAFAEKAVPLTIAACENAGTVHALVYRAGITIIAGPILRAGVCQDTRACLRITHFSIQAGNIRKHEADAAPGDAAAHFRRARVAQRRAVGVRRALSVPILRAGLQPRRKKQQRYAATGYPHQGEQNQAQPDTDLPAMRDRGSVPGRTPPVRRHSS